MNAISLGFTPSNRSKVLRASVIFIAVIAMVVLLVGIAYADPAVDSANAIEVGVTTAAYQLYNIFTAILTPIAVIVFVIALFKMVLGGERDMEGAKKTLLKIILVIAGVWLAPLIIEQVVAWFKDTDTSSVFSAARK